MDLSMASTANADLQQDFARAFGDALGQFLARNGISQSEAARHLGIETSEGGKRKGGARISSYCRDSKQGKRPKPDAEILYLVCTKFPTFSFVYKNYRMSAETLNGNGAKSSEKAAEQLTLGFERQFNLTDKQGTVAVRVNRPQGRIEVSVSLEARAS
jgi:hypothetical protein